MMDLPRSHSLTTHARKKMNSAHSEYTERFSDERRGRRTTCILALFLLTRLDKRTNLLEKHRVTNRPGSSGARLHTRHSRHDPQSPLNAIVSHSLADRRGFLRKSRRHAHCTPNYHRPGPSQHTCAPEQHVHPWNATTHHGHSSTAPGADLGDIRHTHTHTTHARTCQA